MKLIVKRGSLKLPGKRGSHPTLLRFGQALPEGALSQADIDSLVKQGVLGPESEAVAAPAGLPPTRGKWQHDPASLAGKTADQLRAMVLDTDPSVHVDDLSEASMVQLLTSDYEPVFNAPKVQSSDRHRPPQDALNAARRGAARRGAERSGPPRS